MLYSYHESFKFDASRSHPRKATSPGQANPGSLDRDQDRRLIAGFGGPASGMGKRFAGSKSHDSGTLDTWSKSGRNPGSHNGSPTGPSNPTNAGSEATARARSGKASPGIWSPESILGWTDTGSSLEEALWPEARSTAGTILAASLRLQSETSGLCLSSSASQGRPPFSPGVKKNCATLSLMKPSFSRMRPALAYIPGWDEGGLRKVSVLKYLLPANTENDSIYPVGWLPYWGGRE